MGKIIRLLFPYLLLYFDFVRVFANTPPPLSIRHQNSSRRYLYDAYVNQADLLFCLINRHAMSYSKPVSSAN